MGCHYGSRLQQAGNQITLLARGEHLNVLQSQGLKHESEGLTQQLAVNATDRLSASDEMDVVIFSSKMTTLSVMIAQLKPQIRSETLLVTLQNGVEAPLWLAKHFPENPIAAGTAFIGARLEQPGYVVHSAAGGIRLGLWQEGAGQASLAVLTEQLKAAGVPARVDKNPAEMLWRKLLWNNGFNAITAVTRRYASEMCEPQERLAIVLDAMRETVAVAKAEGIAIGEEDIQAHIEVTRRMGPVKTSMWQDIEAGHKTEVDYLNGAVITRAARHGIATPVNQLLTTLIHAIEKGS